MEDELERIGFTKGRSMKRKHTKGKFRQDLERCLEKYGKYDSDKEIFSLFKAIDDICKKRGKY